MPVLVMNNKLIFLWSNYPVTSLLKEARDKVSVYVITEALMPLCSKMKVKIKSFESTACISRLTSTCRI